MTEQTRPVVKVPAAPGEGVTYRRLNHRFCCRCLTDRDTKGGRYFGTLFTCAQCMESLAKAEGPK